MDDFFIHVVGNEGMIDLFIDEVGIVWMICLWKWL